MQKLLFGLLSHKRACLISKLPYIAACLVGGVLCLATDLQAAAQSLDIRGVVEDSSGEALPGVTIIEKGTSNGTITDFEGNFRLSVSQDAVLVVSCIGYKEQEIIVGTRNFFNIVLDEDTQTLDEIVVVGYGTQSRANISGSVVSINVAESLESRPITNVGHILAGMAPGINVQSSSNQPGNDDASITIRGQGTLNDSSPLVIIDGAESSIGSINPQDIESMSVLKDAASAAVYGSRAANGVILITTKQGKSGQMKIDYNGYASLISTNIPRSMHPVSDYATYMELVNEGYANSNMATYFSQAKIDEWRAAGDSDPLRYPNTDWIDATFSTAVATNHVLSMSGGTDKIRFYGSFGYLNNPGVMDNTGFEKYNGRINLSADLKPWITLGTQISGYVSNMEPGGNYSSDATTAVDDVFTYASATTPGMVFRTADGLYGAMNNSEDDSQSAVNNPIARLNRVQGDIRKTNLRARFNGSLKPFKGFSLNGSYSYEFTNEYRSRKPVFIDQWNFYDNVVTYTNEGQTYLTNYSSFTERLFADVTANYERRVANERLGFTVLVGASQEMYKYKYFSTTKYDLIDLSLNVLDAATGDASSSGSSTAWAMRSFFGRLNTDWENKYLLELNLRVDQSSRFSAANRTGYFPSASFAWRLEREPFMQNIVGKGLSNLKLRLSYGSLGNNSVGNYDAIATYANYDSDGSSLNYVLNNAVAVGMAQALLANANLTWETTYVSNAAVDFGVFDNRLSGTVEYFHKRTKDILIELPAPLVHGTTSIPKQNSAVVTNQGVELSLSWQDRIGNLFYGVSGNFTYVKNVVNQFQGDTPSISGASYICEGYAINSQYLLQVDRIIQTDEDLALVQQMIANNPDAFSAYGTPELGDLLYKDINNDGLINENDRSVVSDGPNPKYLFGMNLYLTWKNFDFSMLLQGQAGVKVFWMSSAYNTPTVRYGYQINKEVAEGRWYEGRTDATYPRLLQYSDSRNTQYSDFYLQDKSFVKIRNIHIGYTLPRKWTDSVNIEKVRVYLSLENFFTFTSYKGLDPEVSGLGYPTMRQAMIGLNVSF